MNTFIIQKGMIDKHINKNIYTQRDKILVNFLENNKYNLF